MKSSLKFVGAVAMAALMSNGQLDQAKEVLAKVDQTDPLVGGCQYADGPSRKRPVMQFSLLEDIAEDPGQFVTEMPQLANPTDGLNKTRRLVPVACILSDHEQTEPKVTISRWPLEAHPAAQNDDVLSEYCMVDHRCILDEHLTLEAALAA